MTRRSPSPHRHLDQPAPALGTNPDGSAAWWACATCGRRIRFVQWPPVTVRAR